MVGFLLTGALVGFLLNGALVGFVLGGIVVGVPVGSCVGVSEGATVFLFELTPGLAAICNKVKIGISKYC